MAKKLPYLGSFFCMRWDATSGRGDSIKNFRSLRSTHCSNCRHRRARVMTLHAREQYGRKRDSPTA
jgi:hypothetical protein